MPRMATLLDQIFPPFVRLAQLNQLRLWLMMLSKMGT
jgi:hypothetical protein